MKIKIALIVVVMASGQIFGAALCGGKWWKASKGHFMALLENGQCVIKVGKVTLPQKDHYTGAELGGLPGCYLAFRTPSKLAIIRTCRDNKCTGIYKTADSSKFSVAGKSTESGRSVVVDDSEGPQVQEELIPHEKVAVNEPEKPQHEEETRETPIPGLVSDEELEKICREGEPCPGSLISLE